MQLLNDIITGAYHDASSSITVTTQIFRRAMYHHIKAVINRFD